MARMFGEADAHVARFVPKGKWPLMLAIPQEPLSTEKARSVLPPDYSRADAVTNIQNSILTQTGTTAVNIGGKLNLPATGTATSTNGFNSQPEDLVARCSTVAPRRRWHRPFNGRPRR